MAAAAVLTACDPSKDDISLPKGELISAEQLAEGFTYTQYAMDADGNYIESANGNYIKFATNPSTVVKIYTLAEDGSQTVLSSGVANGMFTLAPARGSSPDQTVYIQSYSWDGTEVIAQKVINVAVATELSPEMLLICSNAGEKTWKWDTSDGGAFWGNFGYTPDSGDAFADGRSGQWWGVDGTAETFANQQQHRGSDTVTGDDDVNAYMVFSEKGLVKCYDANGTEIRSGSFSIENYDPVNKKVINDQAWSVGQLKVSNGAILWPYAINTGGYQPEEFEIVRLSATQLILTYAAAGTGSWSEATFWRFRCDSDQEGVLTTAPNGWTWDTSDGGEFWGNMGYCGGAGLDVYTSRNGKWWGVNGTTETFAGQQQHRGTDTVTGDDDVNAYMIFGTDGKVVSYNAAGEEIRNSNFSITQIKDNEWKVAELNIDGRDGGILWPYEINSNGNMPSTYEVVYLSDGHMVLVYPDGGDFSTLGSWGEASYWRFMKK